MSSDRTSESASYPPIDDYALIGDCRSAGLISRDGSLDWLCLPRFDSPSIFAAVLDAENGGRFLVRPVGEYSSERRYLANTNVLETVFRTPTGVCVLRDLMSVSSEEDKRAYLTPEHEVLRQLEGLEGEVEIEILYEPRPDYGRVRPLLEQRGPLGLRCEVDGTSRCGPPSRGGRARKDRADGSLVAGVGEPLCLRGTLPRHGRTQRLGAEADDLRSVRRSRRGTDHLAPRDDRRRPELGLPLLLATRRLVHLACSVRPWLQGGGGSLHRLAAARHTPDLARAPGALRCVRRGEATRTGVGASGRLRGVSPGADRQRRSGPAPA